jgi:hypothetical protein
VMTSVKKSPTNFLSHTDGIGPSVKLWNLAVIMVGFKKRQIVRWHNIFTNRMTDGVTNRIILSVISSVIFNLWSDDQPSFSPPSFLLLPCAFCFCNKQPPPISI